MKPNKSWIKRIKTTNPKGKKKKPKHLSRNPGGNHFNAKESGAKQLKRKRGQELNISTKTSRRFLPKR